MIAVVQAYDATRRPEWIDACLRSVAAWSADNGFAYRFTDDLFARVPGWFRERCAPEIGPLTDLGRVLMMEADLADAETIVWIDADVLVFDPANFRIPIDSGFFAIDEICVLADPARGSPRVTRGLNGAVLGARRGDPRLSQYRDAIERAVRECRRPIIPRTLAGPVLLTALHRYMPIDVIGTVGLLTPDILGEVGEGDGHLTARLMHETGHPLAAANLCHFFGMTLNDGERARYESIMDRAVDVLRTTRGGALNRLLDRPAI